MTKSPVPKNMFIKIIEGVSLIECYLSHKITICSNYSSAYIK